MKKIRTMRGPKIAPITWFYSIGMEENGETKTANNVFKRVHRMDGTLHLINTILC
jgi:hypothetical protein